MERETASVKESGSGPRRVVKASRRDPPRAMPQSRSTKPATASRIVTVINFGERTSVPCHPSSVTDYKSGYEFYGTKMIHEDDRTRMGSDPPGLFRSGSTVPAVDP